MLLNASVGHHEAETAGARTVPVAPAAAAPGSHPHAALLQQQALLDSIPDAAWLKDRQGRFLAVNQALANVVGRAPAELAGLTDADVWPREIAARYRAADVQVVAKGEPLRIEEPINLHGDEVRWVDTVRTPILDASGCVVGIAGVARDTTGSRRVETDIRLAERRLRQVDRLALIGQLAAGFAHDFNNILGVILAQSELLACRCTPEQHRVREILAAAERGAGLTRRLLALGRRHATEPRTLRLDAVVADAADILERLVGRDVVLEIVTGAAAGFVTADAGELEQVVLNLAVNARDAMPRGGTLSITTSDVSVGGGGDPETDIPRGSYVRLGVADTGEGMDALTRARVFEPFFTTKVDGKGSGLGLATVQAIVSQARGHVRVTSEIGKGTVFSVYLPAAPHAPDRGETGAAEATPTGGSETVLIVEDEALGQDLLREIVEALGYRVRVAAGAAEALEIIRKTNGAIDVLLTDVVMPGISGVELARRARGDIAELAVVYVSGYTAEVIATHGGVEDDALFLEKPFTPDSLGRILREALATRAGPAEAGRAAGRAGRGGAAG